MTVLQVDGASKVYGSGRSRRIAVDNCDFQCSSGEIIGVIGPNGAGKTTLLRMIAGETTISSGTISVRGLRAGTRLARRAVGYVGDPPLLPAELSGTEWLKYVCSQRASHPRERTALHQWAVELADLEDFAGRRISEYSRGMVHRLALASAAVAGSELLVFDEALSGTDPLVARRLRYTVSRLAATGRCIVLASHDLSTLERIATRVLVLWRGRLVSDLSIARLANERVAELSIAGSGMDNRERLLERFAGSAITDDGVSIPLTHGVTIEQAIAVCRAERIPVAASRVRYRALEDILVQASIETARER